MFVRPALASPAQVFMLSARALSRQACCAAHGFSPFARRSCPWLWFSEYAFGRNRALSEICPNARVEIGARAGVFSHCAATSSRFAVVAFSLRRPRHLASGFQACSLLPLVASCPRRIALYFVISYVLARAFVIRYVFVCHPVCFGIRRPLCSLAGSCLFLFAVRSYSSLVVC